MRDTNTVTAQRAALQFVLTSDMPSTHKAVLIETLTAALRDGETQRREQDSIMQASGPWQEAETQQLQALLDGKTARSWQHADEMLMHAANRLGRDPRYVRSKATDLGLGAGVDYRLAQLRARELAQIENNA